MSGFTSGKITHDPQPYYIYGVNGYAIGRAAVMGKCTIYAPRPEFDNHNPILAAMRQELDYYRSTADAVADWLNSIERGDHDGSLSDEKIEHARRVLSRLAKLS